MAQNTINSWWPNAKDNTDLAKVMLLLKLKQGRKVYVRPKEMRDDNGKTRLIYLSTKGRRQSISGATQLLAVLPQ